jgi:predicted metallo-beta-lactamase superfamily hydrolase
MTYKQLRHQKNELQKKLKEANEKIDIMTKTINYQCNRNEILGKMVELETKAKNRTKLRLVGTALIRDKNYKNFINEVAKRNKREKSLNSIIIAGAFIVTGLIALLIRG